MIFDDNEIIKYANSAVIIDWLKEHTLNIIDGVENNYPTNMVLLCHRGKVALVKHNVRRDTLKVVGNTIWVDSFNLILYNVKELPSWINEINIKSTYYDDIQVFFVDCDVEGFSKWKKTPYDTYILKNRQ